VVHDCSEADEGDDRPCVEVCCRKRRLRTQGAGGSPSGGHNRDALGAGSKDRSAGEEAVCASDWEVPTRLGEEGSHSQDVRTWVVVGGEQRACSQEIPWVHE
jgi:hypothetical protein